MYKYASRTTGAGGEQSVMTAGTPTSIASFFHTSFKTTRPEDCYALPSRLQHAVELFCCQDACFSTLLADGDILPACIDIAATAGLPASILEHGLTADTLRLTNSAVWPLVLLTQLIVNELAIIKKASMQITGISTQAQEALHTAVQEPEEKAHNGHDDASRDTETDLARWLTEPQQKFRHQQSDGGTSRLQQAGHHLTLVQSALLMVKLASIAEHSQPAKGQSHNVTRVVWAVSMLLVSSIEQHAMQHCFTWPAVNATAAESSTTAESSVASRLMAAQHGFQLLIGTLVPALIHLLKDQKATDAQSAQTCFGMVGKLMPAEGTFIPSDLIATVFQTWGKPCILADWVLVSACS